MRRRTTRVPPRALHLHERNSDERVPQIVLRAGARHHLHPLPSHSRNRVLRGGVVAGGAGGRGLRLLLLLPHSVGLLLGRQFLRHAALVRHAQRHARLHHLCGDPGLLLAAQRVLHLPAAHPRVLALVALLVHD